MSSGDDEHPSLGRYFGWFTGLLIAAYVLIAIAQGMMSANLNGFAIIAPFFAGLIVVDRFISRERRAPSSQEQHQLTMGGLGIALFANALFVLAFATSGGVDQLSEQLKVPVQTLMIIFFSILAASLVLNYLLLRWAYGGIARKRAEKLGLSLPTSKE